MLLLFLQAAQLLELEHLQPAFVTEVDSAELNHFGIELIVRRNVANEYFIPWLNVGNHYQVHINAFLDLHQSEATIVK